MLRNSTQVFSAIEYCATVWIRSTHIKQVGADNNSQLCQGCPRENITIYQANSCVSPSSSSRWWAFDGNRPLSHWQVKQRNLTGTTCTTPRLTNHVPSDASPFGHTIGRHRKGYIPSMRTGPQALGVFLPRPGNRSGMLSDPE